MFALTQRRHQIQPLAIRQAAIQDKDIIGPDAGHRIGIRNRADVVGKHVTAAQRFK